MRRAYSTGGVHRTAVCCGPKATAGKSAAAASAADRKNKKNAKKSTQKSGSSHRNHSTNHHHQQQRQQPLTKAKNKHAVDNVLPHSFAESCSSAGGSSGSGPSKRSSTAAPGILFSDDIKQSVALLSTVAARLVQPVIQSATAATRVDDRNTDPQTSSSPNPYGHDRPVLPSQAAVEEQKRQQEQQRAMRMELQEQQQDFSPRSPLDIVMDEDDVVVGYKKNEAHTGDAVQDGEEERLEDEDEDDDEIEFFGGVKPTSSTKSSTTSTTKAPAVVPPRGDAKAKASGEAALGSGSMRTGIHNTDTTTSAGTPLPSQDDLFIHDKEDEGAGQQWQWNAAEGPNGSQAMVPNLDDEGVGGSTTSMGGGAAMNPLDATLGSSGGLSDSSGSSSSNANESVLAAIDMLCDDLFACKTDVLRSFARARFIFHGTKTTIVTRLIERAHADAHGENKDLAITRRLLGDVFEGGDVRVSGVRSAWTNRSLEASHIEAACARHFQFQALTNSHKTLVVRRHAPETARMMRRLSRPFQESYEKVSLAALAVLHREIQAQQQHDAEKGLLSSSTGASSSAAEGVMMGAEDRDDIQERRKKTKSKNGARKKGGGLHGDGDAWSVPPPPHYTLEQLKAMKEELDAFIEDITTTELLSPYAAFIISYIRYGSSMSLMSRVDVIEKMQQMGLVEPTIEEEDEDEEDPLANNNTNHHHHNHTTSSNAHHASGGAITGAAAAAARGGATMNSNNTNNNNNNRPTASPTHMPYGQKTLSALMSQFRDIVRLVRERAESTKRPGCTAAQRVVFDCPEFILIDVDSFATKPTDHWRTGRAPTWVQELARTFVNWEICVRTDLQTFADAPAYVFDTILAGVVHYHTIEKIYGRDNVSPADVVITVRGGLKKALERMFDDNAERAAAATHELIAYVNASMETSRGISGDFFIQVLSQMRGVYDMGDAAAGSADHSSRSRVGPTSASIGGLDVDLEDGETNDTHLDRSGEEAAAPAAGLKQGKASGVGEEDEMDLLLDLDGQADDKPKDHHNLPPSNNNANGGGGGQHPTDEEASSFSKQQKEDKKKQAGASLFHPTRYQKRVAMVLKEIGKTVSRCTRTANLQDLLVRVVEDLHFHYRFHRVFRRLDLQDKRTIRGRRSMHLQRTLEYFEREQGIDNPISLEAITYLVLILTFFAMRPRDGKPPVITRYDSVVGIPELAVVGLRESGMVTIRDLRVAFPPQLSYRSWLQESDTREKSVYRVLPSVAVKGPTNEAMIVSQAPMMRALDAISRVPWRIHKYLLHVQEAMVREGYGFGKLRPAFYPLHYTSMHPGTVYYKVRGEEQLGEAAQAYQGELAGGVGAPTGKTAREQQEDEDQDEDEENSSSSSSSDEDEDGDGEMVPTGRKRFDRGNEGSLYDGQKNREEGLTDEGDVVGCNIKQRMAFDVQQADDWKALNDVRSSRTHYLQALRQARSIVPFSHVYFPNSMDFRGRMYPLPGRLNHTGSDPFRALLEYADPKPLGKTGLYWLKVHLANKMGMTKLSFDERVHYVEEHIPDVIQSAESPLQGDRWWQEASEPFQCLMACKELADALKYSQGAEHFPSRLPVAVDGSYNGLQHYSAIGRDAFGAKLVNLVPSERPADAYTGILKEMMKVIERDANHDHPVAQRCLGSGKGQDKNHIKRKTIKRPIMTQVYGVTSYGMAEQIFEELNKQNKAHGLWTIPDMKEMASYLKDKVLDSLGITFRETQRCREWIRQVGALVYSAQPPELRNALCWTTPLGLVVRQPYRVHKDNALFTLQGYSRVPGDIIGPAGRKQLTAMAPNLIHSLDATHLAMTALEMQKEGLSMMAVHDSYWTYACDLPKLSKILRQQFVQLYTQHDPLWELKEQWEEAFFFDLRRHGICLPDPPSRGDLDLNVVLDSPYFFS